MRPGMDESDWDRFEMYQDEIRDDIKERDNRIASLEAALRQMLEAFDGLTDSSDQISKDAVDAAIKALGTRP